MKRNPLRRLREAFGKLRARATAGVHRFGRQTDEVFSEEPIDFSAPSIPYYENMANRLSFVRVVLYMVLFVFVVVTVVSNHRLITYENLYYLVKDIGASTLTAQSEADHLSYPISATDASFANYRGGLAVAGSEVVTVLSGSGRKTLSVNVDYAAPVVRASDKYLLSFGRGETSFAVYNAFVQVHRESTEFPVYDAAVADNGLFAIVTRSRDYTSEVLIYDDSMERLAAYRLGGYVSGLAVNAAGDAVGVISMESRAGVLETKITMIRVGSRITSESLTFDGVHGSVCAFTGDDRMAVMLSDRLLVVKPDATIVREVFLEDREPLLCTISERRIALLSRDADDLSVERLAVYDGRGDELYEVTLGTDHPIRLAGGASHMAFGGEDLYIRAEDTLFCVSGGGDTLSSTEISRDTIAVLPLDDEVRVCTPAYADRLTREDFSDME